MGAPAKRKAPPPVERACAVCGTQGPAEGPLPWAWDQHMVVAKVDVDHDRKTITETMEMVSSCSAKCRAERGWVERKGGGCNG